MAKRAVEILDSHKETPPTELPPILDTLAEIYRAQGKFDRAEPLYQRALTIDEKHPADNPSLRLDLLDHYAALLSKTNRAAKAKTLEARAKSIRSQAAAAKPTRS